MNQLLLAQSSLDKLGVPDWAAMSFVSIAFGAIGYYLLQRGVAHSRAFATFGIVCLITGGLLATITQNLTIETAVISAFCGLSVGGGIGFLTVRQPVYAALGFATAILSAAGIMFMQSALFVAAATIIVYAGATIIIFLFVLMFAQQSTLETYDVKLNNPFVVAIIGAVFLALIVVTLQSVGTEPIATANGSGARIFSNEAKLPAPSSTAALGRSMFTDYLVTVELAGTILLVATIGAIAIAQRSVEVES